MKTLSVNILDSHAEYAKRREIDFSQYLQAHLERDMRTELKKKEQRNMADMLRLRAKESVVTHSETGRVKINNVLFKNIASDAGNKINVILVQEKNDLILVAARVFERVAIFETGELNIYKHDTKDDIALTVVAKRHELYRDHRGELYVLSIIE